MIALRRPSPGAITSGFGPRTPGKVGSSYHLGVDFGWGNGRTIRAAADGTVIFTGYSGGYGNLTRIDHGHGIETRYAHQSDIDVRKGETVTALQPIGEQGNTGTSGGTHLHFELLINGKKVDPVPYFTTTAGDGHTPLHDRNEAPMARLIYNLDNSNENARRAKVEEFTFEVLTKAEAAVERAAGLDTFNVTRDQWIEIANRVRANRQRLVAELAAVQGTPPATQTPTSFTFTGTATPV